MKKVVSDSDLKFQEALRKTFRQRKSSPAHWVWAAESLRTAAELVWDRWRKDLDLLAAEPNQGNAEFAWLGPVWLMLAGMALENALKAGLVAHKRPVPMKGHDLLKLMNQLKIDLDLDPRERQFLSRVSTFVIWAGRYPVPRCEGKMDVTIVSSADWEIFIGLYQKFVSFAKGIAL